MWGNKRGWIFSSIIIFVTALGLYMMYQAGLPTEPSWTKDQQDKYLGKIMLPTDPYSLVAKPAKPGDSANAYRQAIQAYQANKNAYDKYDPRHDVDLEGFHDILDGSNLSDMTLLSNNAEQYVGFDEAGVAPLNALKHVAKAMGTHAMVLVSQNKLDEAQKNLDAIFILGVKLWNERVVLDELAAGSACMGMGVQGLASIAGHQNDAARAKALKDFDEAKIKYWTDTITPLAAMTHNLEPGDAGNLFLLAGSKSQELMWRVEAIRQLARLRVNVGTASPSDQRHAVTLLRRLTINDPDPVVKSIADKASTVTFDELQAQVAKSNQPD